MTYFDKRESCPACESKSYQSLFSSNFDSGPIRQYLNSFYESNVIKYEYLKDAKYTLHECQNCGLIYQYEIPNAALLDKLYGEWLDPELQCFSRATLRRDLDYHINDAGEIMMLIAYFGGNPAKLTFLDFGMGWGFWALMAKAFGCTSYGTELSPIKFEHCKSQGIRAVHFEELKPETFDYINTEQVFEHIINPLETLKNLKFHLKGHGIIKISVPNGNDVKRRLKAPEWAAPKYSKNSLNSVSPLEHINCFNRSSILRMAETAGLQEVRIPLRLQYVYGINWKPFRPLGYTLYQPFYRNVLKKGTYLFFHKL